MNPLLIRRRGMMAKEAVLPDGQLEWIETDGAAYFDTGINGKTPMSATGRLLLPNYQNGSYFILAHGTIDGNGDTINFLWKSRSKASKLGYAIYYIYSSIVDFSAWGQWFDFRTKLQNGLCSLGVRVVGDTTWTEASATRNRAIDTGHLYIFATNSNDSAYSEAPQGSRIASMVIYNTASYTTMLRDYLPWRLNGVVGLWDNVSQTFFAPQGGTLIGGPNVI